MKYRVKLTEKMDYGRGKKLYDWELQRFAPADSLWTGGQWVPMDGEWEAIAWGDRATSAGQAELEAKNAMQYDKNLRRAEDEAIYLPLD